MTGRARDALRVGGWWLGVLALGWLCMASLLDRLAAQGALVRAPAALLTGGNALSARAWLAYREGDLAQARGLARRALARRPIDAAALRVAGLTAIAAGEGAQGNALMRLAGRLGWRDTPTQLYWAEVALGAGALDVAAARLDAVERVAPDLRARDLLRRLEATPARRAALVARWRDANAWSGAYLADAGGLDPAGLDARLATIEAARRAGVVLARDRLMTLGWTLIARGEAARAWRLLERADPGPDSLAQARADAGPFAWTLAAAPGLEAASESRDGATMLHVLASGPAPVPLATRFLRLDAGEWRLQIRVAGAASAIPLLATLGCLEGGAVEATPADALPGEAAFRLRIPRGCATQRLMLSVAGEEARRGADLWLGAVRISRAAAPAP